MSKQDEVYLLTEFDNEDITNTLVFFSKQEGTEYIDKNFKSYSKKAEDKNHDIVHYKHFHMEKSLLLEKLKVH